MIGIALIILIVIALVIVVATAIAVVYFIHGQAKTNNIPPAITPSCEQRAGVGLPDLGKQYCCVIGGVQTLGKIYYPLNMLVYPYSTSYLDVCLTYCGNYDSSTQTCTSGNIPGFDKCISALKPRDCNGAAMPIALDGPIYYYGSQELTADTCSQTWDCRV